MFEVKVGNTYRIAKDEYKDDLMKWNDKIDKITDLFMRINKTDQAEIISSILYVNEEFKKKDKIEPSEFDILIEIQEWKQRRKPQLNRERLAFTIRNLSILGWLNVKSSKDISALIETYV